MNNLKAVYSRYEKESIGGLLRASFEKAKCTITKLEPEDIPESIKRWMDEVVVYNVWTSRHCRPIAVINTYKLLMKGKATFEEMEKAAIVGWCTDFLMSYLVVHDDIMDRCLVRRGIPCWYLMEGVGNRAVNDATLLLTSLFKLIIVNCRDHPFYLEILELFLLVTRYGQYGQGLDMIIMFSSNEDRFRYFKPNMYAAAARHKFGYPVIDLTIRAGMYLAGLNDPVAHKAVTEIGEAMGLYLQVENDYLDCFGDSNETWRANGTDIQEGKCSWLAVEAYSRFNAEQKKTFEKHYGIDDKDSIRKIVELFEQVKVKELFWSYKAQFEMNIKRQIESLCEKTSMDPAIFYEHLWNSSYLISAKTEAK